MDTQSPQKDPGRIAAIDGLRGLAALLVLYIHLYEMPKGFGFALIHWKGYSFEPTRVLSNGTSGVTLFFILSGFCLSYPIMMRGPERADWKRYFIHRARRILPPYWAMYLLWASTMWVMHNYRIEPWATHTFNATVPWKQFWSGFFLINIVYSEVFWTLVVEARWYFVLPLLLLLFFRFTESRYRGALIFGLTVALSILWNYLNAYTKLGAILKPVLSTMPAALWAFGAGIWIADIIRRQHFTGRPGALVKMSGYMVPVVLVLLFVPIPPKWALEDHRFGLWTILYFFLLLAALHHPGFNRVFSWQPLVAIGGFSYSLYLSHMFVIIMVLPLIKPLQWSPMLNLVFYTGFLGPVCIAFGYLFYRAAEKPFLRKPSKLI